MTLLVQTNQVPRVLFERELYVKISITTWYSLSVMDAVLLLRKIMWKSISISAGNRAIFLVWIARKIFSKSYKYFIKFKTYYLHLISSGEEYKTHVKCISEEEKYSAKGWVPKQNQNKNERKQTEWVSMVQELVNSVKLSDPALSRVLQTISQHENIPRKKPKFMVKKLAFINFTAAKISCSIFSCRTF